MDLSTKASLDLVENARSGKKQGSLFWLLDETKLQWVCVFCVPGFNVPLIDKDRILERQEVVQVFLDYFFERSDLTDSLKGVYDIERLASRVSFGKPIPRISCSWRLPYPVCHGFERF